MLRLMGIAVSIGLADSLNPSTIAPALYLAAGDRPRATVTRFTVGVFLAYFLGGLLIAAGPGQLLRSVLPAPTNLFRHVLEILAGVAMIAAAGVVWRHRTTLARHEVPTPPVDGRSSTWLGIGITAIELPTAFPYFAAIAAIIGSGLGLANEVILLVVFNVCFVLPLIGIVATLWIFGEGAEAKLARGRDMLENHWPAILAGIALLAGVLVILIGATGVASRVHGRIGRFFRHLHHLIPIPR